MRITEEQLYQYVPMAEAQMMAKIPKDEELPKHIFSKKFERKMKRLIRQQTRTPQVQKMLLTAKRVAIVVLLFSTLTFSCFMTVEAFRMKVIEIITDIFDDLTQFTFFSSSSNTQEKIGEFTFNYLPDGMTEISYDKVEETQSQIVFFEDADGRQLQIDQQVVANGTDYDLILDTEEALSKTITVDGKEFYLITKGEWSAVIWDDGPYIFTVGGDLPPEEVIKIANGIDIKNN